MHAACCHSGTSRTANHHVAVAKRPGFMNGPLSGTTSALTPARGLVRQTVIAVIKDKQFMRLVTPRSVSLRHRYCVFCHVSPHCSVVTIDNNRLPPGRVTTVRL